MAEKSLVCPECGRDMAGLNPVGHALTHYPDYLDPARSSRKARAIKAKIESGGVTPEEFAKLKGGE